jgi:hypothetical protein
MTLLQKIIATLTWIQSTIMFFGSLWSLKGEYLFSAIALFLMFVLLLDDCKNIGSRKMTIAKPLGHSYHLFRLWTLAISCVVNLVVYVRMASM